MRPWLIWPVALLGCACAGLGVTDAELPEQPIAIHYRTPEEARRRAEAFQAEGVERARTQRQFRRQRRYNAVVPHLDQLEGLLRRVLGDSLGETGSYAGRLALLHPRTREVTLVAGARRGAIPLDWSPNRDRLLFAQPEGRVFQLWELRVADGRTHPLTHGTLSHIQGCYAEQGRLVAVAARRREEGVHSVIVRSQPGGRGPFVAISEGPVDHSPTCALREGRVAWVAEAEPGRPEILLGDLTLRRPPRHLSPGRDPAFAPDSSWLLFSAPLGRDWRDFRLWRMRPDAGGRVPLGAGGLPEFRPTVSPDGRFVAYVASEEVPKRGLYLRRIDGSGDRVLFADGDAEHPVW